MVLGLIGHVRKSQNHRDEGLEGFRIMKSKSYWSEMKQNNYAELLSYSFHNLYIKKWPARPSRPPNRIFPGCSTISWKKAAFFQQKQGCWGFPYLKIKKVQNFYSPTFNFAFRCLISCCYLFHYPCSVLLFYVFTAIFHLLLLFVSFRVVYLLLANCKNAGT